MAAVTLVAATLGGCCLPDWRVHACMHARPGGLAPTCTEETKSVVVCGGDEESDGTVITVDAAQGCIRDSTCSDMGCTEFCGDGVYSEPGGC